MIRARHAFFLLAACSLASCTKLAPWGTTLAEFEGEICGTPVKIDIADGKARQSFRLHAQCDEVRYVTLESTDSTTDGQKAAVEAIESTGELVGTVGRFVTGMGWVPTFELPDASGLPVDVNQVREPLP